MSDVHSVHLFRVSVINHARWCNKVFCIHFFRVRQGYPFYVSLLRLINFSHSITL